MMQRSVASFGLRMWRRCALPPCFLSYKKVSKGSEFLPGYVMQAPGLVDLKRRRRLAARVLLSDARGGDTDRARGRERSPSPEQDRKNSDNEPLLSNAILAEPAPADPEQGSCCTPACCVCYRGPSE